MKTILLLFTISLLPVRPVHCDSFFASGSGAFNISILVNEDGKNLQSCLSGALPCHTLDFVLNNIENVEGTEISVFVLYSHDISSVHATFVADVRVTIRGENQSLITCHEGSQVFIDAAINNASVEMEFLNMYFARCGSAVRRTPGFLFRSLRRLDFYDCVFYNCSDLVVDNAVILHVDECRFDSNIFFTSALNILLDGSLNPLCIDARYTIGILNSVFINNVVVESLLAKNLYIIDNKSSIVGACVSSFETKLDFLMDNCSFSGSRNLDASAFAVSIAGFAEVATLTVTKCSFVGMVSSGHLIHISAEGRIEKNIVITINDTLATMNTFRNLTGVMNFNFIAKGFSSNQNPLRVILFNNTIKNNVGIIGLRFIVTNLATSVLLHVMASTYSNNTGTAMNIGCVDCQEQTLLNVTIDDVVVSGNDNLIAMKMFSGIMLLEHCELHIKDTNFIENVGTAAELSYVDVYVQGVLLFDSNFGTNGGACRLGNNVSIYAPLADEHVSVQLLNNVALYGGAFHLNTLRTIEKPLQTFILERNCTPKVNPYGGEDSIDNTVSACNFTLSFDNNTGTINGDNAFVVDPTALYLCGETCITPLSGVASSANSIAVYGSENTSILTVFPGQNIVVNMTIKDLFDSMATCEATVFLKCGEDILICGTGENTIRLSGTGQLTLTNTPSISPLQISSPNGNLATDPTLVFQCPYVPQAVLTLNVSSCPIGFVYNSATRKCQCAMNDSNVFKCSVLEGVACVAQNHWIGSVAENEGNQSQVIVSFCPYPLCTPTYSECPIESATSNSPVTVAYILLPFSSDEQCSSNRGGPLCKECAQGSKSTFEAALCIQDERCEIWQPYVLILLAVVFQLMLSLALMYIVRYTKEIGLLYGPLFFVAVVNHLPFGYYLSFYELKVILSIFSSYLLLNFSAFGQIPWCFYLDPLPSFAFQFLGPLISALVLFFNILCAKLCPRLLKRFNIPPIQTVCFLAMLSFWTLADTSISILRGQSFSSSEATRVYIQPSLVYFTGIHIPLVLISVLLLLFVILPFIGLLLLAPLIGKKFSVNLSRVQPFLDVFQSSFKDNFRWYPAVYFITWVLFLATDILEISLVPQIMVMIMAALQFILLPFKRVHLNVMNSFLLFDIVLIMFLLNEQGNTHIYVYSQVVLISIEVIVYGLTLAPLLYFLLALASIVSFKTRCFSKFNSWRKKNNYEYSISDNFTTDQEDLINDSSVIMRRVSFSDINVDLRESLLESFP